ncbi:MAG: hypothetical protein KBT36_18025 [Kurthia sp.]|uniref:hypothetical protein n=1 Tax=Acinetobacter TaxID=469 RepID=UPI0007D0781E|nr:MULTISPECIES: hypothetical protein [Acinetobacter]MBQ0141164.1 hypothetical protein [Candidatus Kurthia equi]OAL85841.1 hypothetical protein AY605_14690 [Acinetobacter sp. SFD]PJI36525.1 hypothetical protein CU318_03080 [Acinetobacter pseudolwoffii]
MKILNCASIIAILASGFIAPAYAAQTELSLKSESIEVSHETLKIEHLSQEEIFPELQSHQQQQQQQQMLIKDDAYLTMYGTSASGFDV